MLPAPSADIGQIVTASYLDTAESLQTSPCDNEISQCHDVTSLQILEGQVTEDDVIHTPWQLPVR